MANVKTNSRYAFPRNFKALELKNFATRPRTTREDAVTGISTRTFGHKWFVLPKGEALFKTFDSASSFRFVRQDRMANEILCFELAKILGIDSPECEYAKYSEYELDGIISYNFLGENDSFINGVSLLEINESPFLSANTYYNYQIALPEYAELHGLTVDREKVMFDIFKMMVFDFVTFQSDRHPGNINFVISNRELSLAPMFDNEFAFATELEAKCIENGQTFHSADEFLTAFDSISDRISVRGGRSLSDRKSHAEDAKDIVSLAKANPKYMEFLKKVLSLDFEKVFESLKTSKKVALSASHEKRAKNCICLAKHFLSSDLEKQVKSESVTPDSQDENIR